jgi:hypothetical protein
VIDEDEEGEKIRKSWVDGEFYTSLFYQCWICKKNAKKKGKFCLHPSNFLSTLKP